MERERSFGPSSELNSFGRLLHKYVVHATTTTTTVLRERDAGGWRWPPVNCQSRHDQTDQQEGRHHNIDPDAFFSLHRRLFSLLLNGFLVYCADGRLGFLTLDYIYDCYEHTG